ncbi:hypothetical protein D3C73_1329070 [compost metagenome]
MRADQDNAVDITPQKAFKELLLLGFIIICRDNQSRETFFLRCLHRSADDRRVERVLNLWYHDGKHMGLLVNHRRCHRIRHKI